MKGIPMTDKTYDGPPEMALKPGYEYYANFATEKGPVKVRLFAEEAPETVNNFVFLASDGYFDGTTFHRVIADFMVQGTRQARGLAVPGTGSRTSFIPICATTSPAFFRWQTLVLIPAGRSFSLRTWRRRGSMTSTPSSGRSSMAWKSSAP